MASDLPDDRDPAFANAYAISYRLLGERALASGVATRVSSRAATADDHDPRFAGTLEAIAGAAVEQSLEAAAEAGAELGAATNHKTREALRERFRGATPTQRQAAALVHLAGYPRDDVAELLGSDPEQVDQWCAPFEPPAGRSWADLGDPEISAKGDGRRAGLRRVPLFYWILGVCVVALGVWAATSVGKRPSIESLPDGQDSGPTTANTPGTLPPGATTTPDDDGTTFSVAAPTLPSAGCSSGGGEPGPQPLLVLVGDAQTPPEDVAKESGLFDLNQGWVKVPALAGDLEGSDSMLELLEQRISEDCVDLNRTFVVGFGEGGRVAAEAACSDPQLITGIVMVAGWAEPDCRPGPRVAVLAVGAQDDPRADAGTALEELGNAWAEALGAGPMHVDGRDEDTLVRQWSGPGDVTVQTVATVTGGHSWTAAASLAVGPFLTTTARSLG